jgi:hypothetical protein
LAARRPLPAAQSELLFVLELVELHRPSQTSFILIVLSERRGFADPEPRAYANHDRRLPANAWQYVASVVPSSFASQARTSFDSRATPVLPKRYNQARRDDRHISKELNDFNLVPLAGLEPARCCHHLILSQARLPIPPQGQGIDFINIIRIWIARKQADGHQNGHQPIIRQPAAL